MYLYHVLIHEQSIDNRIPNKLELRSRISARLVNVHIQLKINLFYLEMYS